MKHLIKEFTFAILIILTILFLGLLVPIVISTFISITTDATFTDCVQTTPFWIFTIIGLIISGIFINEVVVNIINDKKIIK